jgi:hypothetical protein
MGIQGFQIIHCFRLSKNSPFRTSNKYDGCLYHQTIKGLPENLDQTYMRYEKFSS